MSHSLSPAAGAAVSTRACAPAQRVVLAGGSPADRQWVSELLRSGSSWDCEFLEAESGEAVLRQVQATACATERILLAGPLADMDALRLLALLAGPQGITPCPVVVITPGNGRELGPVLLRAGAQDYIGEDWLSPFVLARAVDNARVRWATERELRERDLALQRSEAGAREADLRKDEFLAMLAHELRNPLAPIRNGLEILRRSGPLTGPAQEARNMMERQLGHMVRLVDDLLPRQGRSAAGPHHAAVGPGPRPGEQPPRHRRRRPPPGAARTTRTPVGRRRPHPSGPGREQSAQ